MKPIVLPATVVPLIARLGSDADRERLACLRQLDRILGRAGVSWTDLARRLEQDPGGHRPDHQREPDTVLRNWRVAVQWIASHPLWDQTERERQFISDIRRILKRQEPSEKQADWIRGIVERLGGNVHV